MRNKYSGVCYRCGGNVVPLEGHFEKQGRVWLVQHADCAIKYRGTEVGRTKPTALRTHKDNGKSDTEVTTLKNKDDLKAGE